MKSLILIFTIIVSCTACEKKCEQATCNERFSCLVDGKKLEVKNYVGKSFVYNDSLLEIKGSGSSTGVFLYLEKSMLKSGNVISLNASPNAQAINTQLSHYYDHQGIANELVIQQTISGEIRLTRAENGLAIGTFNFITLDTASGITHNITNGEFEINLPK
jgi:hypothetical protein